MKMQVRLTESALRDLEELFDYVSVNDSPEKAEKLLGAISHQIEELAVLPQRGVVPQELRITGIQQFREVFFKPYRIIYQIEAKVVYVHLIADGRRNMQTHLMRRLLGRQ